MKIESNIFVLKVVPKVNKNGEDYCLINFADEQGNIYTIASRDMEHLQLNPFNKYLGRFELNCSEKYGMSLKIEKIE